MAKQDSLNRTDWIRAAIAVLGEAGIDAVRVEPLARRLKTSKGSFYWHFRDRAELLEAILLQWEAEGTEEVIAAAAPFPTPRERLFAVLAEAVLPDVRGTDVPAAEGALRAWAGQDEAVATRVRAGDARRVDYLRGELMACGHAEPEARRRAEGLYLALLGYYATRRYDSPIADEVALQRLLELALA